ncbi:unnamed protein product [Eruca vesicaria subsp. sativa]|uniref:Histone-lysine N-methyltransferase SUVR4 n=1 Tax=Eruca vesicaria subsp. sativa TaxID=29727 RepID=A0ABC8LXM6_ERUVS|nr:unnamed protein product [Eruca vesicaria subsp. sativa]
MQPLLLTDERVRKACEKARELKIPDEKTLLVLRKLLRENGGNWGIIRLDNYTVLIDAIYSLDEEENENQTETSSNAVRGKSGVVKRSERQSEGSSNGIRGKNGVVNVIDSPPSVALKKQTKISSYGSRGKNDVVIDPSPSVTLKKQSEGSSYGNRGKNAVVLDSPPSAALKKQSEGSSCGNRGKDAVVLDSPPSATLKKQSQGSSNGNRGKNADPIDPYPSVTLKKQSEGSSYGNKRKNDVITGPSPSVTLKKQSQGSSNGNRGKNGEPIDPSPSATLKKQSQGSSNGNRGKSAVVLDPSPGATLKKQSQGSSNGNRGKSDVVLDSPHSATLKKQSEGSSNGYRGKDAETIDPSPSVTLKKQSEGSSNGNKGKNVDSPGTLKTVYETRSATSGLSVEEVHKQPQMTSSGVRKRKYKTIIQDITKGSESVEISLVDVIGTEKVPTFTYIPQNIVYQSAYVHVSLARISDDDCCATCKGDCLSADFPCACARETSGEYAYTKDGLLKEDFLDTCLKMKKAPDTFSSFYCQDCPLEEDNGKCQGHLIRKFIKECWRKCGCDMLCGNRVVQRGIKCQLQVYFTPEGKGWGVRTLQDLPKGTFVFEYIGEILTNTELDDRNLRFSSERHTYPVTLDADWGSEKDLNDEEALCLDATFCGNVARFVNHRCEDANLIDIPVQIETPDRHYYHIAFFTNRDVKAMEELTWDYMIDFSDESHPVKAFRCSCGSELCRDIKSKGSRGKPGIRRKLVHAKRQPDTKAVPLKRR